MRRTPLTHLTEMLLSFSLRFFCDYVCLAKHFHFASSPDQMQASLTVIARANNAGTSRLSMFFPMKGEGKVEVSTRSPWGNEHSIVPLPFPLTGKNMQVSWVEVFHAWWEVQGKNRFICSTRRGIKSKSLKIRTHFAWWEWMHPRNSNTCISTMLLLMLVWLPPFWKKRWGIDLLKGLLISDLHFEWPSGLVWTQGML